MEVYYGLENIPDSAYAIVTAGTFDGVHLGHQALLKRVALLAKENGGHAYLITYNPHPRLVLQPEYTELRLLTSLNEKLELLAASGIDRVVIIPFTKEFSETSSEQFIQDILVKAIKTKKLVIGYDHRFGKNREGGFDYLKEHAPRFGFAIEEISKQEIDEISVSSTTIRKALLAGKIEEANKLLGHTYQFTGKVVKGKQLGRTLGYPTANLELIDTFKLIPANGVYAITATLEGQQYKGMMSIGINPTVAFTGRTIEAHLFNFSEDIYGKELTVHFHAFLREEKKYNSLADLIAAIANDEVNAKAILGNIE